MLWGSPDSGVIRGSEAPDKIIKRINPKRQEYNLKLKQKKKELERMQSELATRMASQKKDEEKTIRDFLEEEKELEFTIKNIIEPVQNPCFFAQNQKKSFFKNGRCKIDRYLP